MCVLTFAFKLISIVTYLITTLVLNSIGANKTYPLVITVLAASLDFWVVKNLTGR